MTKYEQVIEQIRAMPGTWLITGVAGFIGSHLLETLLKLDQRVVGLDNLSLDNRGNMLEVKQAVTERHWQNFRFILGDIQSLDTCRQACRSVEYVLHQAALGSASRSIENPILTNRSNVTGLLNMLVAAHGAGVKSFVLASSSAIYGAHPRLLTAESEAARPQSPYALTKHIDELYADMFARCYGFSSIGLRYFNVFGPRQDPNGPDAAVIPAWIAGMIRDDPVYINGDGKTSRDFCHVDNVVQANLLAATTDDPDALNQVYNVAVNQAISLNELFEMIRSLLEPRYPRLRDLQPRYRGFRAGDVQFSLGNIDKAERLLGYRPVRGTRGGLERTISWYDAKLARRRAVGGPVPIFRPALGGS
jgi:UDP-N-acetylglucosamine/UDP-N-acetyl-alpha-D-glucosaminouronate 4-epimerase